MEKFVCGKFQDVMLWIGLLLEKLSLQFATLLMAKFVVTVLYSCTQKFDNMELCLNQCFPSVFFRE